MKLGHGSDGKAVSTASTNYPAIFHAALAGIDEAVQPNAAMLAGGTVSQGFVGGNDLEASTPEVPEAQGHAAVLAAAQPAANDAAVLAISGTARQDPQQITDASGIQLPRGGKNLPGVAVTSNSSIQPVTTSLQQVPFSAEATPVSAPVTLQPAGFSDPIWGGSDQGQVAALPAKVSSITQASVGTPAETYGPSAGSNPASILLAQSASVPAATKAEHGIAGTQTGSSQDPVEQDARQPYPAAKPQAGPPSAPELDQRRASAPIELTWNVAQQLGLRSPAGKSGALAKADGEGRAEISPLDGLAFRQAKKPTNAQAEQLPTVPAGKAIGPTSQNNAQSADPSARLQDAGQAVFADIAAPGKTVASTTSTESRIVQHNDIAQLVDRLVEGRVQARADRSQIDVPHPDFGKVTLALGMRGEDRLSIDLPGAPQELRQAVVQAISQTSRSEPGSHNNAGNSNPGGQISSGTGSDGGANADRQQGDPRDAGRAGSEQEGKRPGGDQTGARQHTVTPHQDNSAQPAEDRRGVLA